MFREDNFPKRSPRSELFVCCRSQFPSKCGKVNVRAHQLPAGVDTGGVGTRRVLTKKQNTVGILGPELNRESFSSLTLMSPVKTFFFCASSPKKEKKKRNNSDGGGGCWWISALRVNQAEIMIYGKGSRADVSPLSTIATVSLP